MGDRADIVCAAGISNKKDQERESKDRASGGQCLVAWKEICKPLEFGGLGVKNLRLQGLALRVRWDLLFSCSS
jgi:hypothetical protein